jgi:hypothetical protein
VKHREIADLGVVGMGYTRSELRELESLCSTSNWQLRPNHIADNHVICFGVKLTDDMKRTPRSLLFNVFFKLMFFELNSYTLSPRVQEM